MEEKKQKIKIIADNREACSKILNFIAEKDVELEMKNLDIGDYILSDEVCVERKTVSDFLQSIIDQRIFNQIESMTSSFKKSLLIIEGEQSELFNSRGIHENAIRGVLSSLTIDYRIPIIWTRNQKETALQMHWIASREQKNEKREPQIRVKTKNNCIKQQQEFLLAGLPFVSTKMSKRLLKKFKTPKRVFNAKIEKLVKVEKMGDKKAKMFKKILDTEYED